MGIDGERPRVTGRGSMIGAVIGAVVTAALLTGCLVVPPLPAGRAPERGPRYVALGDSWVSGPLVPDLTGTPIDCGRSSQNSPQLIARELGIARFVDASCGGAKTVHLREVQKPALGGLLGVAPPQLDALTRDTTLVTIGIGGNDVGFPNAALSCINIVPIPLGPPPFGQPCRDRLTADGVDQLSRKIAETRPEVDRALRAVRRRAPRAEVYVVGYPTALPDTGPGCWPTVPLLEPDVQYLREKYVEMNRMLARVAAANRMHFVDTYTASIGHDVCQPVGTAWINGATFDPPALPMHPNAMSLRETARLIVAAVRST